ncbi:MAG: hypothetical protein ACRDLP_10620 [Solirubrobacteraceae bacterium]
MATRVRPVARGCETGVAAWNVGVAGAGVERCAGGVVPCGARWRVTGVVVGVVRGADVAGRVGVVVTAADDGVVAVAGGGAVADVLVVLVTAVGAEEVTGAAALVTAVVVVCTIGAVALVTAVVVVCTTGATAAVVELTVPLAAATVDCATLATVDVVDWTTGATAAVADWMIDVTGCVTPPRRSARATPTPHANVAAHAAAQSCPTRMLARWASTASRLRYPGTRPSMRDG